MLLVMFQALAVLNDEVNITTFPVTSHSNCSNKNWDFFSTKGVVRLEILDIVFTKLSYSFATSLTGT